MIYNISNRVYQKVLSFYENVSKKYPHTFTYEDLQKKYYDTCYSINKIENGLLRQKPTISRWKGLYMATTRDRK